MDGFPLTDLIQTIGLVATMAIAIWQMRIHDTTTRASVEFQLITKMDEVNRITVDQPELWRTLGVEFDSIDDEAVKERVDSLLFLIFNTFAIAYRYHKRYKLIRQQEWELWEEWIAGYKDFKVFEKWWAHAQSQYMDDEFNSYVTRLPVKSLL